MEEMPGQGMGKGCGTSMPCPGVPLLQHLRVLTNLKLSKTHPLGFLWKPHYIGVLDWIIGHWGIDSLPRGQGWDWKVQPSHHKVPLATSPIPREFSKSHFITMNSRVVEMVQL